MKTTSNAAKAKLISPLPLTKNIQYMVNDDHRILFHHCKGKTAREKIENFFLFKDFDCLELTVWLKSFFEATVGEKQQLKDYQNIPTYVLEVDTYLTMILGISFTNNLSVTERLTLAVFVEKLYHEKGGLLNYNSHYASWARDSKIAVLLNSPYINFMDRMDTAMQLLPKCNNIYTRIFIESSLNYQETQLFLDNYEDLYAAVITKLKEFPDEDAALTLSPIDLETFVIRNKVLDPFQKIEILSAYIEKFHNFVSEDEKQRTVRKIVARFFEHSGFIMSLNDVLRYDYWIPFFGSENYFKILSRNAKRQGNSVSRYRSKIIKFHNEKEWEFNGDVGGITTNLFKKFYSERGTYSE